MKIAIVVQGRFHAFDLARELSKRGHEITLFTNYPERATRRFDLGTARLETFAVHGVASKVVGKLNQDALTRAAEPALHRNFGQWAASRIGREQWDVIHCWSGVSEELLREHGSTRGSTLLMRGSAHIRAQARILEDEERRTGIALDRPSLWMIEREEREYRLADKIVVLSSFARESFVENDVPASKLLLLPLGVDCGAFRPAADVIARRLERIGSGARLRVLYAGSLSLRKGVFDAAGLVRELGGQFDFRFVGPVFPEAEGLVDTLRSRSEVTPRQPEHILPEIYAESDLFLFPTIEDGFAMVLSQAQAGGLPILATTNCAGPDMIRHGETGWILPIRSPERFAETLLWCDAHRAELAAMAERIYSGYRPRDWAEVAADFEQLSLALRAQCV